VWIFILPHGDPGPGKITPAWIAGPYPGGACKIENGRARRKKTGAVPIGKRGGGKSGPDSLPKRRYTGPFESAMAIVAAFVDYNHREQ